MASQYGKAVGVVLVATAVLAAVLVGRPNRDQHVLQSAVQRPGGYLFNGPGRSFRSSVSGDGNALPAVQPLPPAPLTASTRPPAPLQRAMGAMGMGAMDSAAAAASSQGRGAMGPKVSLIPAGQYPGDKALLPLPTTPASIQLIFFPSKVEAPMWDRLLGAKCDADWGATAKAQLANWVDSGITLAALDRYCVRRHVRVSIVSHELRAAHWSFANTGSNRMVCVMWLLQLTILRAVAQGRAVPDVEMLFQTSDGSQSAVEPQFLWDTPGPLFGSTKCNGDASISFPMNFHDQFGSMASGAMSLKMYQENLDRLRDELGGPSWAGKTNKAFFSMGSHTGKKASAKRGHRAALMDLDSPLFDIVQKDTPLSESGTYKYLIYAYGRCGWSRRLHELAFSPAVVFLEGSNCSEFFLSQLEPGKDYIPVAEDFSDLQQAVERVHADGKAAAKIAASWGTKAQRLFTLECVLDYVEVLLRAYAKLQRFSPAPRPAWPLFDLRRTEAHTPRYFGLNGSELDHATCPDLKLLKFNKNARIQC